MLVHLKSLDLSAVEQSRTELESEFPIDGQWARNLKKFLIAHQDTDWLFPSSHRDIRFGQLCDAHAFGISIDTVDMDIIDLDIQTAEETGDWQRLSQLLEIKKSIVE